MPRPREPSSDDFVARLADGDERAWAELYQQYAGRIAGYARTKGVADPDDLLGEVFAAAAERVGDFDGDERALRSWLFTIAHHRLADDLRRRSLRATDPTEPSAFEGLEFDSDAISESLSRLDADGALEMLSWVTDDQREVLTVRILGQLSIVETAAVLGKPPGAIKALQHRAITRIQRRLDAGPYPTGSTDDDGDG